MPAPRDAVEPAVLPPVRDAEETAVLPPVRGADPADRVPPGPVPRRAAARGTSDDGGNERTRELPQIDPATGKERPRPRSEWAEETPLDDLPTLADELLGPREDEDDNPRGGRRRWRRRTGLPAPLSCRRRELAAP